MTDEFDTGGDPRPYLCEHPSSDGIDQAEGPDKVFCGALHLADGTRVPEPQVKATFDEHWAEIVRPNGEWDHVQVMAELADYWHLLKEVPKIYMEITGGLLSKTSYFARGVIDAHQEHCPVRQDLIDEIRERLADEESDTEAIVALHEILDEADNPRAQERRRLAEIPR